MNSETRSNAPAVPRAERLPDVAGMLAPSAGVSVELAEHHVALDGVKDRLRNQVENEIEDGQALHGRLTGKMLARLQAEIESAYRLWQTLTDKMLNQVTGEILAARATLNKIVAKLPPGLIDLGESLESDTLA